MLFGRRVPPAGHGWVLHESGLARRFKLEPDTIGRGSLSCLLDFLAALVGVMVERQLGLARQADDILLCQGGKLSATGWIACSSLAMNASPTDNHSNVSLLSHGEWDSS